MAKLSRILAASDGSDSAEGMDLSGFRLHLLKDGMKGHHAVFVSPTGGWRFVSIAIRSSRHGNENPVHPASSCEKTA